MIQKSASLDVATRLFEIAEDVKNKGRISAYIREAKFIPRVALLIDGIAGSEFRSCGLANIFDVF